MANRKQENAYAPTSENMPYTTRLGGQCVAPQSEERASVIIALNRGMPNPYEGTGLHVGGDDLVPDVTPYTPPLSFASGPGTPAKPNVIPYTPADAYGEGNPQ